MNELLRYQEDVDWVGRRSHCTDEAVFDCLLRRIKQDILAMNKELHPDATEMFSVCILDNRTRAFIRRGETSTLGVELKMFSEGGIQVRSGQFKGGELTRFVITHTWNLETGTCDLHVDDKPMQLWEISQKALYGLFFPGPAI